MVPSNSLARAHSRRVPQPCRSSLAELMARTSLDLELDLQASRTRQRQLNEEICALRELRQRLEDAQLRGQTDLPHWVLRDERFRSLLKEAERQVRGRGPAPRGPPGPDEDAARRRRTGRAAGAGCLPPWAPRLVLLGARTPAFCGCLRWQWGGEEGAAGGHHHSPLRGGIFWACRLQGMIPRIPVAPGRIPCGGAV